MNELEYRLDLMKESEIINDIEKEVLLKWIDLIMAQGYIVNKERLEGMITHCAMMMKRQKDNVEFEELPDNIFQTIMKHDLFSECCLLYEKMNCLYPIHEKEKRYVILHLCNCFRKE